MSESEKPKKPKKLSREETLTLVLEKLQNETFTDEEVIKVKNALKAIVRATKKPSKLITTLKPRFVRIYNYLDNTKSLIISESVRLRDKLRVAHLKYLEQKIAKSNRKMILLKEKTKEVK